MALKHLLGGTTGENICRKNKKHYPVAYTFMSQIVKCFLMPALNLKA